MKICVGISQKRIATEQSMNDVTNRRIYIFVFTFISYLFLVWRRHTAKYCMHKCFFLDDTLVSVCGGGSYLIDKENRDVIVEL